MSACIAKDPSSNMNFEFPVHSSSNKISSQVHILRPLCKSHFPIFLAYSKKLDRTVVVKAFPYQDDKPSSRYTGEARIAFLSHPNIIKMIQCETNVSAKVPNMKHPFSWIIMELAPFGDLVSMVEKKVFVGDEKLVRTYFHQLIDGLEYLHSQGVAHLDLKLENLLIGEDLALKIADFEACYFEGDDEVISRGTVNFRAPEIIHREYEDPAKADIYSAGIVLFGLMAGVLPYDEKAPVGGHDLYEMVLNQDDSFWEIHNQCAGTNIIYDNNFKSLFFSMVKEDPKERASIKDSKLNKWYQKPVYTEEELILAMMDKVDKI